MKYLIILSLATEAAAIFFPSLGGSGGGYGCGCGGGCERKKREALNFISNDDESKCNSEDLRKILLENMKETVKESLEAIREAMKEETDFAVFCDKKTISFAADTDDYCQVKSNDLVCTVLKNTVKQAEENKHNEETKTNEEEKKEMEELKTEIKKL